MTGVSWAVLAMCASLFWGFSYTMCSRSIQAGVSTPFILGFVATITLPFYLFVLSKSATFKPNLDILASNKMLILFLVGQAVTMMAGQYLIYAAILQKNATSAAVLEISYPLFICLFTWLLFREVHFSWSLAVGGLLIFAGSALVLLKAGA